MKLKDQIQNYNIELTTRCTAHCPFCARVQSGFTEIIDLDLEVIKKIPFESSRKIVLSGSLGEPTCYPKLFELLEYCFSKNPELQFAITTNGFTHNEEWWKELAKKFNKRSYVIFGIDGLEDTHSRHRRGTDFHQIIKNAKSFISAGGCLLIQTIVFKYNEHQLPEIRKLADDIGASATFYRPSKEYNEEFPRPEMEIKTQGDMVMEGGPIYCLTLERRELFLNVEGYLCPCYLFSSMRHHYKDENKKFQKTYLKNLEKINLYHTSYEEAINNQLFDYIMKRRDGLYTCNCVCKCVLQDLFHFYGKTNIPKPL